VGPRLTMRDIENAEKFFAEADQLIAYVAHDDRLAGLLYDCDLLVEQKEVGSRDWLRALIIISAFRDMAEERP